MVEKIFGDYTPPAIKKTRSEFRWLNIGYLLEKKGHTNLIKVFAKVFKGNKNVKLRIAGDGPKEAKLKELAIHLEVQDQIQFLGLIDRFQVLKEIAASDAFVLSSHYETFGVVVIEALSMGKPVVATACGGPENIITAKNGILVPPENDDQLARAMLTLMENISIYNAKNIRQDCIRRFGERSVVKKIDRIYSDTLINSCSTIL